ncbi:acyl carrier protein [Christensenella sp. MSJ-20]|uniref:acyl carrier protein n=1 Tax=Christensenella sp. MSJ-20 TaxID=2841518 RepID=UPI001C7610C0|nr:acyl carrier protein [Christensenella sp. MSJ-20]
MEFEKIAEIIANTLSIDKDDITPDSTFKSLSVDSLDMVEIIMEIEQEFGVTFDDSADIQNVDDVVKYIQAHA